MVLRGEQVFQVKYKNGLGDYNSFCFKSVWTSINPAVFAEALNITKRLSSDNSIMEIHHMDRIIVVEDD